MGWRSARTATCTSPIRGDGEPGRGRGPRPDLAGEILESARGHEARIDDLYQASGRERSGPGRLGGAAATLVAKGRQAVGHAEGLAAGARGGSWRKVRELLLTNLDAISGFAVTEQLGLALGNPVVTGITVPILTEKSEHQLQLQELLLELAANAILYQRDT